MPLTLQHKRALVTGGSRGIGAAIVKRLARVPPYIREWIRREQDRPG